MVDLIMKSLIYQIDIGSSGYETLKRLKTGCGATFSEGYFTRRVFRHMYFQFFTIYGLKCSTAAVQGIQFCKISMLASQIAPSDPVGGNPRVFRHWSGSLYSQNVSRLSLRFSIWERVRFIKSSKLTPYRTVPSRVRTERVPASLSLAPMVNMSGI